MPTCDGIREEYIRCLLRSECVFIKRHSAEECIKNRDLEHLVPEHCQMLRKSLFECKRGLLDMRKRMRGVPNSGLGNKDRIEKDSSRWNE